MKQGLQFNVSQQMSMTPALQQAIRLLQLSTHELQQEIQSALEENMMLELDEAPIDETSADEIETARFGAEETTGETSSAESSPESLPESLPEELPQELSTDSNWEDTYDTGNDIGGNIDGNTSNDTSYDINNDFKSTTKATSSDNLHDVALNLNGNTGPEDNLQDYLQWQLDMANCSDLDRVIAEHLIDAIDDDGFLQLDAATAAKEIQTNIAQTASKFKSFSLKLTAGDIEPVIHRIQSFDPPGVAARDLRECLLLQLRHLMAANRGQDADKDTDLDYRAQQLVKRILEDYFAALSKRDLAAIKRRSKCTEVELHAALKILQRLNPRPGNRIGKSTQQYVVPDIFIYKHNDQWQARLNSEHLPKIRVNQLYADLCKQTVNPAQRQMARDHLTDARWLVKNLQSRNETLLAVAQTIVARQQAYFEQGDEAMQPMILREIAETVDMHESTISRITSSKYMDTPRGVLPFKYFFSSQVSSDSGDGVSATAIQARIKRLIQEENQNKPLSDSKISALLNEEGIQIARRTVTKYREAMIIPSSSERKHLA